MAVHERAESSPSEKPGGAAFGRNTDRPKIVPRGATMPSEGKDGTPRRPSGNDARVAPEGVDIPTMGKPKWRYEINKRRGRPDLVPALTEEERLLNEARRRTNRILLKESYIWDLSQVVTSLTFWFGTDKGGASKTTNSAYLAEILSQITRHPTVLLPATNNTNTSSIGEIFGIDIDDEENKDLLTVSTLYSEAESLRGFPELSARFAESGSRRKSGLWVVYQDRVGEKADPNRNYRLKIAVLVDLASDGCGYKVLDLGNDDPGPNSLPVNAVQMADVAVFSATAGDKTTCRKMQKAMATYANEDLKLDEKYLEVSEAGDLERIRKIREERFPTVEKIRQSVVVISGLTEGQTADEFGKFCSHRSQDETQLDQINGDGHLLGTPWDPYIASGEPVSIPDLQPQTYESFLDILIAMLEQGAGKKKKALPKSRPTEAIGWEPAKN